jgi:hypothetical protein
MRRSRASKRLNNEPLGVAKSSQCVFILRNNELPNAPVTHKTPLAPALVPPQPKNRRERRLEAENRPEVKKWHEDQAKVEQRVEAINCITVDPSNGLYLSTAPSVKFAECRGCKKRYEILSGSPLLEEEIQVLRDDRCGEWWALNPDTECPDCSRGHRMSGWCIITDTLDSDSEDEVSHEEAMKAGRRSGSVVAKEYNLNGSRVFEYLWSTRYADMCLCTSCIRTFELAKYDHGVKEGEKIIKYLRDPADDAPSPPPSLRGLGYCY